LVDGKKTKVAFVLGGGGARGLAHIGVIRVLSEAGIVPDLVVGTSMGAVIGGMFAQYGDIETVERKVISYIESFGVKGKWLGFLGQPHSKNQRDLFRDLTNYVKKQYVGIKTLTRVSLEEKEILLEPLRAFFRDDIIENCKLPFAAVAVDLRSGKTEVMTSGPIIESVYASAAVEGAFPPLETDGKILADGGPIAIVPVEIARNMGAGKVIAVDVSPGIKEEECSTGLEVILRADTIAQNRLRLIDLSMADIVISPRITAVHWANFSRVRYCVRRGELATRASLDKIMKVISPLPWWKKIFSAPVDRREQGFV